MNAIQRRIADAIAGLPTSRNVGISLDDAITYVMRCDGMTLQALADQMGVVREAIRQRVVQVSEYLENPYVIGLLRSSLADIEPITEPETYIDDRAEGLPQRGLYENDGMFGTAGFKRKYYESRRNQNNDCERRGTRNARDERRI